MSDYIPSRCDNCGTEISYPGGWRKIALAGGGNVFLCRACNLGHLQSRRDEMAAQIIRDCRGEHSSDAAHLAHLVQAVNLEYDATH